MRARDAVASALVLWIPAAMMAALGDQFTDDGEPETAAEFLNRAADLYTLAGLDLGWPLEDDRTDKSRMNADQHKQFRRIQRVAYSAIHDAVCDGSSKSIMGCWRAVEFWLQDLIDADLVKIDQASPATDALVWMAELMSGAVSIDGDGEHLGAARVERIQAYDQAERSGRNGADRLHAWLRGNGYGAVALEGGAQNA